MLNVKHHSIFWPSARRNGLIWKGWTGSNYLTGQDRGRNCMTHRLVSPHQETHCWTHFLNIISYLISCWFRSYNINLSICLSFLSSIFSDKTYLKHNKNKIDDYIYTNNGLNVHFKKTKQRDVFTAHLNIFMQERQTKIWCFNRTVGRTMSERQPSSVCSHR